MLKIIGKAHWSFWGLTSFEMGRETKSISLKWFRPAAADLGRRRRNHSDLVQKKTNKITYF
jgi:hypothetical protein